MKLDLTKLSDAVTKVAGLAHDAAQHKANADASKSAHDAILADLQAAQSDIDTLTASLIAATTSPAEAVGLAAVAAAVAPTSPAAPVAPAAPVVAPAPVAAPAAPAAPVADTKPVVPSTAQAEDLIAKALAAAKANAPK